MNSKPKLAWTGAFLIAAASIWTVIAAPLSANEVITVVAEIASYWLALVVVVAGSCLFFLNYKGEPVAPINLPLRYLFLTTALTVIFMAWHFSSEQFVYWKMRSIPQAAWPKMVSDLEQIGRQAAQSGATSVSSQMPMPKSLQQLGLNNDYSGGMGNVWKTPEYDGPVASALFGYKNRSWGLCVGPESFVSRYARRGNYIRVASNAYFFYGARD